MRGKRAAEWVGLVYRGRKSRTGVISPGFRPGFLPAQQFSMGVWGYSKHEAICIEIYVIVDWKCIKVHTCVRL